MSLSSGKTIGLTVSLLFLWFPVGRVDAVESGREIVYTTSNTIVIVDVGGGEVLKEVPLDHFVTDILFSKTGDRAYVGTSNGVMVLDTKEYVVVERLTDLPVKSMELSSDNGKLYVMDHPLLVDDDGSPKGGEYHIKSIDLVAGKTVQKYVLGRDYLDFHLAADDRTLFTIKARSKAVEVIDTSSWQKLRTVTIDSDEPLGRSVGSSEKEELYIPQYGVKGVLWILNTGNDNVRKIELNEELILKGIAYSKKTDRLYILSTTKILVVDTSEGKILEKEVAFDTPYQGVSCSSDGKKIFLSNPMYRKGGSVTVMDGESLAIEKVIDIPTISPMAIFTKP
jgi:DNA-binding beta-propeller fold protein YncE